MIKIGRSRLRAKGVKFEIIWNNFFKNLLQDLLATQYGLPPYESVQLW